MLILHCLTTMQLLKDSGYKKLNIRDFIFNVHTFWIHGPLSIKNLFFTFMFFNKVPLNNQSSPLYCTFVNLESLNIKPKFLLKWDLHWYIRH
jgi:hypothetical protein